MPDNGPKPGEPLHVRGCVVMPDSKRLGPFAFVKRLVRASDGTWNTTHQLRIKREPDHLQDSIRHGVNNEPPKIPSPTAIIRAA